MNIEELTKKINALYHKSLNEGLSEEEKLQQQELRKAYIQNVRANLRGQLNQISIQEDDGNIVHLGETYGNERTDSK